MEEADGLSFDFEGGLDAGPAQATASVPAVLPDNPFAAGVAPSSDPSAAASAAAAAAAAGAGRGRSFRQTVCRHWLRGLCMKGDACGFLHQYDKSRMPVCRFFRLYGECREQDCVYKHTNEDIKECNMYKLGFCPNGPDCRYRHAKLPGPPPSVEEVLQKIQQLSSYNHGPNRFYQQRNAAPQQIDKSQVQGPATTTQGQPQESGNLQPQQEPQQSQQGGQAPMQNPADQTNRTAHPLPQGVNRYFIVKSCNRENLELSVQQGVWATQRSNEAKLNEAFDSVENVILIFSVNRTRHFQGCAKMTSRIGGSIGGGNWKHEHGTAQYGRNFSVKWLKLCELSFHKTRHLRNPYNENLPVKISRDCQELEPSIGEQLASLLYVEPDSELMAISLAAEAKREEEKAKGVINPGSGAENPDIVPFEDNEEEEEEEEESEEEEDGMGMGPQGRGRGRGMMWPPQMPMARGARPMPGMGGFPIGVMGADAFPYGPGGYGVPDPFGVAPRPFVGPYGPRFGGDFRGPIPGMMFPGRPPQPFPPGGFGMMGGAPGRGPMMGGMGPAGPNAPRGGRPMYLPPPPPLSQNVHSARSGGKDQKTPERSDAAGQEAAALNDESTHQTGQFETRNEESESEDEAPRRSRHGEGKKRR